MCSSRPVQVIATTRSTVPLQETQRRVCTHCSTAPTTTVRAASTTATPRPTTSIPATATWRLSTTATALSGAVVLAAVHGLWLILRTVSFLDKVRSRTPPTHPSHTASSPRSLRARLALGLSVVATARLAHCQRTTAERAQPALATTPCTRRVPSSLVSVVTTATVPKVPSTRVS